MSFPPATEMFQFAGFASHGYEFTMRYSRRSGLPHSEIRGSKPIGGSPQLIAAYHVLHRLLAPRHPPNALLTLDLHVSVISSKSVAHRDKPRTHEQIPLDTSTAAITSSRYIRTRRQKSESRNQNPNLQASSINSTLSIRLARLHQIPHFWFLISDFWLLKLVEPIGIEPATARSLTLERSVRFTRPALGGADRDRTDDLLLAKQALSQLSYGPDQASRPR